MGIYTESVGDNSSPVCKCCMDASGGRPKHFLNARTPSQISFCPVCDMTHQMITVSTPNGPSASEPND